MDSIDTQENDRHQGTLIMRILYITNSFSEGGVETFLITLIQHMTRRGHDVRLLVLQHDQTALVHSLTEQGIPVEISPYNCRDVRNIGVIAHCAKDCDLIHVNLWPAQYYAVLAKLLWRLPARLITTEHTTTNKRRLSPIWRPIERCFYRHYNAIIGVSKKATENLQSWLNLPLRYLTILNGINTQVYHNATPLDKKHFTSRADALLLVMVARFFNQKDQQTVVRAMPLLPSHVEVLFCGSGDDGIRACQDLAKSLSVSERCHFLGSRKDIPNILQMSDIAILSSFYEGFPISLLEYLAAGKPVIATDIEGNREVLTKAGRLFPVGDEKALAAIIREWINNPSMMQYQAECSSQASHYFSVESMINAYEHIYNDITAL